MPRWLLEVHLPVGEVGLGEEPAGGARGRHQLARDVAAVEAVVGGADRLLAIAPGGERAALGLDQRAQRGREPGLPEHLPRLGRLAGPGSGT
jgi:hypothetical protein